MLESKDKRQKIFEILVRGAGSGRAPTGAGGRGISLYRRPRQRLGVFPHLGGNVRR